MSSEEQEQIMPAHCCPVCKKPMHEHEPDCSQRMTRTKMFLVAMATLFSGAAAIGGFLSGWFIK